MSSTPSQRPIGLPLNSMECGFYDYLLIPLAGKLEVCRVSPSLVAALNLTTERLGLPSLSAHVTLSLVAWVVVRSIEALSSLTVTLRR